MSTEIALIRQSLIGTKIRECDDATIMESLAVIVAAMFATAGQKPEKKDVKMICREVCKDLKNRYKGLTLDEVKIACDNGVRGDYGDYFGINVVSINKWLKAYYYSEERQRAQREKLFKGLPQRTALTADEILQIKVNAYREAYGLAAAGKYVPDLGNLVYNFLDSRGKISFTKEEKLVFVERARAELETEAKERAREALAPVRIDSVIARITDTGIIQRAKRIALNEHFRRILEKEK
ncbi:MAG: hypothetical protein LBQ68_02705 [Clostridiales bacterium]|nr:hypothetical protein [Clostridiales bacterium]